ncbi:MAG: hypothetical protein EHM81_01425, partial [Chloroflexi bacterium]
MTAKTLILGSMSSAGKSLLVTALCCIYARRGVRVAPFKAQNMSNNAAICPDAGEIGRAQVLQAAAAGLAPCVDMNPVLIRPEGDSRSQVILMGPPWSTLQAKTYYEKKAVLWEHVTASLDRLRVHRLIKKVAHRYRYHLTELGRQAASLALKLREFQAAPALA